MNLEELSQHYFLWDGEKTKKYQIFYNNNNIEELNQQNIENDEDYKYLLNRTWYKVQQIVKSKPEVAKNFYDLLDKLVKEICLSSVQNNQKIQNPKIIKPKGKFIYIYIFYFIFI